MPEVSAFTRHFATAKVCAMNPGKQVTVLLGIAGLALVTTIVVAAQTTPSKTPSPKPQVPSPAAKPSGPIRVAVSTPPLPSVGFAPVRPMDVVRATYDFAAQHPEILKYVPCYCGCGEQGHKANESCFVASRSKGQRPRVGYARLRLHDPAWTWRANRCSSIARAPMSWRFARRSRNAGRRATPAAARPHLHHPRRSNSEAGEGWMKGT